MTLSCLCVSWIFTSFCAAKACTAPCLARFCSDKPLTGSRQEAEKIPWTGYHVLKYCTSSCSLTVTLYIQIYTMCLVIFQWILHISAYTCTLRCIIHVQVIHFSPGYMPISSLQENTVSLFQLLRPPFDCWCSSNHQCNAKKETFDLSKYSATSSHVDTHTWVEV